MSARGGLTLSCVFCASWLAATGAGADNGEDLGALRQQLQEVLRSNQALQERVDGLEDEVRTARDEARAARESAARPAVAAPREDALVSAPVGRGARFQLMDISLDVLASGGGSSAGDDVLELLQGGGHDPRRRGFNLQNVELSFTGAVDPWFTGEAHLIYFLDAEGESRFEIEEAFAQTQMLPFGLERHGLQLEVGQFFTEFGRLNPTHPHTWDWQDQPVVNSRFFGEDGMRNPGVRAGWLLPVPWFSELHVGAQNAQGETMLSFDASDEAFEERAVGGRPFADPETRSVSDLVYLARWVNGFDLSDTWTGQVGVSGVVGPNATGPDGRTWIAGADAVLKWVPLSSNRGWPFLTFEGEWMFRSYRADDFFGCPDGGEIGGCDDPLRLASDTLEDQGGYAQVLWGFRRGWAAGLRGDWATGSGASVGEYASRSEDPFRGDRLRISPLLVWYPSEFSRVRLQYNLDDADFLDDPAHTVWLGFEFLFGSHPAHRF